MIRACHAEDRALVTLDLGFSNPLVFPPQEYSGIAVVRLPRRARREDLHQALHVLDSALTAQSIIGERWIIETTRIRVYRSDSDD